MKQHISLEQLSELSDKAKERLRSWWKPKRGDHDLAGVHYLKGDDWYERHTYDDGEYSIFDFTTKVFEPDYSMSLAVGPAYPLLSIGQMIEFLGPEICILSKELLATHHQSDKAWHVATPRALDSEIRKEDFVNADELCFALWEAVKGKLENE